MRTGNNIVQDVAVFTVVLEAAYRQTVSIGRKNACGEASRSGRVQGIGILFPERFCEIQEDVCLWHETAMHEEDRETETPDNCISLIEAECPR